jgi:hypothetical protein
LLSLLASNAWLVNLRPRFEFLAEAWAPRLPPRLLAMADALQWRAARQVLGLPRSTNNVVLAVETGWMSARARFLFLSVSWLVHLNGRMPPRLRGPLRRPTPPVTRDRFARQVFDGATYPLPPANPWLRRRCLAFQPIIGQRMYCVVCRNHVAAHPVTAIANPAALLSLQAHQLGHPLPVARDFTISTWFATLADSLQSFGFDWLDPAGGQLPATWRSELRSAIRQRERAIMQTDLARSAQRLMVYRQVVRGPGEFFRWRRALPGVSDERLSWWCRLRCGQLDYGINTWMSGRQSSACLACNAVAESPAHFLLGHGCVDLAGVWHRRRHWVASRFRRSLSSAVGPAALVAYDKLPFSSRLLVSLGAALPSIVDDVLWPCWEQAISLWESFWAFRACVAV